mmetsp:Transcript_26811/g.63710  ORF Transcript_26811/g.63710 Transcript_26811/m.63710 type:complete len:312 (+) Transcript_26811:493-1428(+)
MVREGNDADDPADDARHPMQVVDAARVVQLDRLEQERLDVGEAQRADRPCDRSHHHGPHWALDQIARSTHRHSTSKGRVLNGDHVELAAVDDGGHQEGGDAARPDGHDGVENGEVLEVAGQRGIEGRPADPEEEGADHSKDIMVGARLVVWRRRPSLMAAHQTDSKPKVCAEEMDCHSTADVSNLDEIRADVLVNAKQWDFHDCHGEKLQRSDFAKNTPEADHDRSRSKQTVNQAHEVNGDTRMGAVELVALMEESGAQHTPVDAKHAHKERASHRCVCVAMKKRHEKAEANENHNRDVVVEQICTVDARG